MPPRFQNERLKLKGHSISRLLRKFSSLLQHRIMMAYSLCLS